MEKNIITQVKNKAICQMIDVISDQLGIFHLKIENYEEFFHALIHVSPKVFVVEVSSDQDPYLKIIGIVKKSILTKDIPIIVVVTSKDGLLLKRVAKLDIQAVVYDPIDQDVLELYIRNIIYHTHSRDHLQIVQDIRTVQSVMISGLASLAEYRDPETGEHIKRTQNYVKALATTLKRKGLYEEELTLENIDAMYMSVPLHDIGKVGIRDDILLKPGKLTDEEFEIMKTHAKIGYDTIRNVANKLKNNAFLEYAADVAYTHHEKYDGSGYPRGLKGDEIPLIGRLMAVADVYDALTSKRVYKDAMSHEEAMEIIKAGIGKHFDPVIVSCAISLESTFQNIAHTYRDFDDYSGEYLQLVDLYERKKLKNILVVEDSRIVREITKNQLAAIGFDVDVAVDGEEGYRLIMKNDYDLVILDLEMPKLNGYEMALKVKNKVVKPILIAMTAADFNVTIHELKEYNISGLILKPLDFNRLATLYNEIKRH